MDEGLLRVLEAREKRWQHRQALVREGGCTLITITLCVPADYRTSPEFGGIFLRLCRRFCALLRSRGCHYRLEGLWNGDDGPAFFLSTHREAREVKLLCTQAESLLGGGRMLDIDVLDREGEPVGRSQLGLPPRECFVCRQPAAVCVSRRVHSREEVDLQVARLREEALAYLEQHRNLGSSGRPQAPSPLPR